MARTIDGIARVRRAEHAIPAAERGVTMAAGSRFAFRQRWIEEAGDARRFLDSVADGAIRRDGVPGTQCDDTAHEATAERIALVLAAEAEADRLIAAVVGAEADDA